MVILIVVDGDVIDLPLGVMEIGRICDCFCAGSWASKAVIDGTGPVTTEGGVKGQDVIIKMGCHITRFCGPKGGGGTP